MSSQKRTVEEIDADLDKLKVAVATGEREIDNELMGEAFALVAERFGFVLKFGFEAVLEALLNFPYVLLGETLEKLGKAGEKGAAIVAKVIAELIARLMYFIMFIMSFATFGIIPAPPNLEVVFFFYEWLRSIFDLKKELEEGDNDDNNDNTGTGNIV